jgi:hypothetical protein
MAAPVQAIRAPGAVPNLKSVQLQVLASVRKMPGERGIAGACIAAPVGGRLVTGSNTFFAKRTQ